MKRISNAVESIEKSLSMLLIVGITLVLFMNVVYRYFLNDPIYWANEASIFMMAWLTFLGGSLGLKYKSQASITFLTSQFSETAKRITSIITHIIILLFIVYILYISYNWIFSLTDTKSSSMRIPMWIPYLSVPIGFTFAFIHLLSHLIEYIKGDEQGGDTL